MTRDVLSRDQQGEGALAVTDLGFPKIESLDVEELLTLPEGYRCELHEGNLVTVGAKPACGSLPLSEPEAEYRAGL